MMTSSGAPSQPISQFEQIEIPTQRNNLTYAVVKESCPQLFQVEYPGLVQNAERAMRTLGGIHKVSEVMENPKKRLELRFRPGDIYCKPAYGEPGVTCGLLIKLRRRKSHREPTPPREKPSNLIDLSNLPDTPAKEQMELGFLSSSASKSKVSGEVPLPVDYKVIEGDDGNRLIVYNGPLPSKFQLEKGEDKMEERSKETSEAEGAAILNEEQKFLEDLMLKKRMERVIEEGSFIHRERGNIGIRNRIYIRVPGPGALADIRAPRSNFHVEVLGVIPRYYKFNGMCDFQYLPMKRVKNRYVSIINKIVPPFPNPDGPNATVKDLIICDVAREGHGKNIPQFIVPPIMSRVDKPIEDMANFLEGSISRDRAESQPQIIRTTRAKRVIYSILCNFRITDDQLNSSECLVPKAPMPEATEDASKRGLLGAQLEHLKNLFEQRPCWTRMALEYETNYGFFALKYMLPCVAYFALNGPWRSCWIRYGYDPRKNKSAYFYQLLDYRVPYNYKSLMDRKRNTTIEVDKESLFCFKPNTIPPKCQMIYQFCEIRTKEMEELNLLLQARMDDTIYNTKYGFLSEDIIEYCRYCISRNIELFFLETGRIETATLPEIVLPADGEISKEFIQKAGGNTSSKCTLRKGKRNADRAPIRPFSLDEGDDASVQSSNIGDLTIREDLYEDEDEESSDTDSEDEDQRIMAEALEATSAQRDGGGTDTEEDQDEFEEEVEYRLGIHNVT